MSKETDTSAATEEVEASATETVEATAAASAVIDIAEIKSLAKAKAALEGANASITDLEAKLEDAKADVATSDATATKAKADLAESEKNLTEATAKIASLESEAKAADEKAQAIVAGLGVDGLEIASDDTQDATAGMSETEKVHAEYAKLHAESPRAAANFYAANSDKF